MLNYNSQANSNFTPKATLQMRLPSLITVLVLFYLSGCSNYEFTVNDRTVYDPTKFRRSLSFADAALTLCAKAVAAESNITAAGQLLQLQCGPGEIINLSGLSIFHQLESLGLSHNQIENISEIAKLEKLKHIDLSNNKLLDVSLLAQLPELELVNLKGNTELHCETTLALVKPSLELQLPKHCQK
ncbi:Leucine rich repeat-containing protein [Alteromonadaceae bacterium Bs31]|nr:Leucine rich repeat-containing protein [Alteromonadaceae bacterium Bs31]